MATMSPFIERLALAVLSQVMGDNSPLNQARTQQVNQETSASQLRSQLDQQRTDQQLALGQQKLDHQAQSFPLELQGQTQANDLLGLKTLEGLNSLINPPTFDQNTFTTVQNPPSQEMAAQTLGPALAALFAGASQAPATDPRTEQIKQQILQRGGIK